MMIHVNEMRLHVRLLLINIKTKITLVPKQPVIVIGNEIELNGNRWMALQPFLPDRCYQRSLVTGFPFAQRENLHGIFMPCIEKLMTLFIKQKYPAIPMLPSSVLNFR